MPLYIVQRSEPPCLKGHPHPPSPDRGQIRPVQLPPAVGQRGQWASWRLSKDGLYFNYCWIICSRSDWPFSRLWPVLCQSRVALRSGYSEILVGPCLTARWMNVVPTTRQGRINRQRRPSGRRSVSGTPSPGNSRHPPRSDRRQSRLAARSLGCRYCYPCQSYRRYHRFEIG